MHYDPIKRTLGNVFNRTPGLRKLFYRLLDTLLLRSWHIHKELKLWKRDLTGVPSILDAGSGFGQYAYFLSRQFDRCNLRGIDVKEEQIEECNAFFNAIGRNDIHFEVGDLTKLNTKAEYDLVLCVDVMEHIEEDVLVLTNYANALKKGGMLLISTPSDQGGSDVHGDDESSFIEEHVRDGYNVEDMRHKLTLAGFSKSEIRYSYGSPGKISWKLSMKIPMLMLNQSKAFFIILPFYYLLVMPFALILNAADVRQTHPTGTGLVVKAWK
jgi:2-polyprenyl-3-methyl-5-hydroxy-6-metoxy-1,4-benzoquinol methylase